jgi:osmotically-inducible protein OsmY
MEIVLPAAWQPSGVIEVAVDDGVVTLAGQVPSLCYKRLTGVLTWWVPGSREIIKS